MSTLESALEMVRRIMAEKRRSFVGKSFTRIIDRDAWGDPRPRAGQQCGRPVKGKQPKPGRIPDAALDAWEEFLEDHPELRPRPNAKVLETVKDEGFPVKPDYGNHMTTASHGTVTNSGLDG